jgi:hypothetical protein
MARKLELDLVAKSNADVVLNRVQKASQNFASGLVSKFTAAFGAMALFDKFTSFAIDNFREFGQLADQISKSGLAADQFQMLAYAAKQSGADVKDVTKAVRELNGAISDAKVNPGGQKGRALLALGFSPEQIAAGTIKATDVFLQLSRAMEVATSDADRVAIATALLGDKVGQNLIPMLQEGRAELLKLFGDAPIVSGASLKSIDEANDKVDAFTSKVKGLAAQIQAAAVDWFNFTKGFSFGPIGALIFKGLNAEPNSPAVPASDLPAPDVKSLINTQAKATAEANSSMGGGVIGVGASPQIALAEEANTKLDSIDSKLGQLVNSGGIKDPTKMTVNRFPIRSPGAQ